MDCKGGVAVALLAMAALEAAGVSRPLRLILMSDEELSNRLTGPDGIAFLQAHARGCAAAFVCECGKRDEAVVERKGILKVRVDIRGRAAHAGMYYAEGISAVREAAPIKSWRWRNRADPTPSPITAAGSAAARRKTSCRDLLVYRGRPLPQRDGGRIRYGLSAARNRNGPRFRRRFYRHNPQQAQPMPRTEAGMALFDHLRETGLRWGLEDLRPLSNGGGSDAALYRGGRRADGLRRGDDRLGLAQRSGAQRAGCALSAAPSCWPPPLRNSPNGCDAAAGRALFCVPDSRSLPPPFIERRREAFFCVRSGCCVGQASVNAV